MRRLRAVLLLLAACGGPPAADPNVIAVDKRDGGTTSPASPCDDKKAEAADASSAFGKKIAAICFDGAGAAAREAITKKLELKENAPLTEQALRDALRAVHASGAAADVSAYARKFGADVVLVFAIKERPRVAKVDVTGASLATVNVKKAAEPTPLHVGEYYDPAYAFERAEALRAMYVEESFEDATVTPKITRESDGTVDVLMVIAEGTRSKVGKITIRGVSKELEADVAKEMKLAPGEPITKAKVEMASLLVNKFYYDRGYMTVRVSLDRRPKEQDGTVPFILFVQEGAVYRIGKVDVAAKTSLDDAFKKSLVAKLKTKPGQVFKREQVLSDREVIQKAYAERGKNDVEVEPETELDHKKKIVDLVFRASD